MIDDLKFIIEMQEIEREIRFEKYIQKRANREILTSKNNVVVLEQKYSKLKEKLSN